jgi:CDP-glucose 4,6-dehydratase
LELSDHRVLVTGAYGLIGSWLVRGLLERGARVCVIRRDQPALSALTTMGLEQAVDVVVGDICAEGLVLRALSEYAIDSVFHLAAQTIVGTATNAPISTFETNVRGTWMVLEACRLCGVKRVIVASSDKAYGASEALPYREDSALSPRSPYEVSKACADLLARSYWYTWGLPVAVTRLANVYGGGDSNRSRLVPEAVTAALRGRRPWIRSDGTPERDFLYVEDAVDAYIAVWKALPRRGAGGAFNAGGDHPVSVRQVLELVCRLTGSHVEPEFRAEQTSGEIQRQWVDSSKLRMVTGWEPQVDLEEGLRRTIGWYREHAAWLEQSGI